MYIHEAIKKTTADLPYIARHAWVENVDGGSEPLVKILPTNTPDCCLLDGYATRRPSRGWQPRKEDLVADDWAPYM